MQAAMQPTSNEVKREGWDNVRRSGRVSIHHRAILDAIRLHGPCTRQELVARTGLPISSVCGRCHELLNAGRIEVVGTVCKPARQVLDLTAEEIARAAREAKS